MQQEEINTEDVSEPCEKPCKICKEDAVYRSYNMVDGDLMDDGCWCMNCHDWVEDPDS